jgi:diguanylate cyclase (GGDEF)-like protein
VATALDPRAELACARGLLFADKAPEALELLDDILAGAPVDDPELLAPAYSYRLIALINMRRSGEYAPVMDALFDAARLHPGPQYIGQAYALAALVAQLEGSLERCVEHLVRAAQMLKRAGGDEQDLPWAWHNLAMAYSYAGFPNYANSAIDKAREVAPAAGEEEADFIVPVIRLRLALSLDHQGDTEGCLRVLHGIGDDFQAHRAARETGVLGIRPGSRGAYGYAMARLAAYHEPPVFDPAKLLELAGDTVPARGYRLLGRACLAIAGKAPREALDLLEQPWGAPESLGEAEIPRLTALAHHADGNYTAAITADRAATLLATRHTDRLRDLFIDAMAARMDYQNLSQRVARYAGEARTDPLTSLPNRRHLEQYLTTLVGQGRRAVIGVCDLDGFKAVNTVHGHLAGDMVLQRVAVVLGRVMRAGDFVARYGGDEFVVVLPGADTDGAYELARRIIGAVAAEDWESLVPGTPVGLSVGWAAVRSAADLPGAFEAADRAMLDAKYEARAS